MTRKTLYADDVKAAIENCFQDGFDYPCDAARQAALVAIDSLPAAESKALLDSDEVKAVLAEALASQPMAKVWVEAAIDAMCGKVVGDAADARGEEG